MSEFYTSADIAAAMKSFADLIATMANYGEDGVLVRLGKRQITMREARILASVFDEVEKRKMPRQTPAKAKRKAAKKVRTVAKKAGKAR